MRVVIGLLLSASVGVVLYGQVSANKKPLGPEVNTKEFRELLPLVSADGQTLYFTREDRGEVAAAALQAQVDARMAELKATLATLDPATRAQMEKVLGDSMKSARPIAASGQFHQSVYTSRRGPDGRWLPAERLPPPLAHDAITLWAGSVLPDNNTLLVAGALVSNPLDFAARAKEMEALVGDDFLKALGRIAPGGDVAAGGDKSRIFAWAKRTATGWTAPEPLRLRNFTNTSERIDMFLAPDGRHLLLSIVNAASVGKRDLFVASLGVDDVWETPRNLGASVNTTADELSPFVAPDGTTMYFASDRPGSQGFDIWMTRRLDHTWLKWTAPVNMGPEINTAQDDMNLAVDAGGLYAFMSIGPLGQEDIYEFALPAALRPRPVAIVRGRVTDPQGRPLPASIAYEFLRDGNGAGQANAAPADGRYQIALPIGEDYAFRGSAAGYVAVSDRLDLRDTKEASVVERDLVLVPLEVGQTIRLNNVFFDTAKSELLPDSRRELNRLVQLLTDMPSLVIEVRGHTDSVDADDTNLRLSEARAAAVVAYLTTAGVSPSRLKSKGFGEQQPIASNDTDKGRQQNRRVEFLVVSK